MPKRSATDALAAVVPAPKHVEGSIKSRSGRTVKPRVWDDGTLAAPLAALKDDAGEPSPVRGRAAAAADAADPDFSLQAEAGGHSGEEGRAGSGSGASHGPRHSGGGGHHHHHHGNAVSEGEEMMAYSSDSPRASVDGSQGNGGSAGRARSGSVGRDEHGKFTAGPRPRGRGGRGGRGEGGGGIFKMAAVEVLRLERRLMSTGEIARVALKRGLIKCSGKTPEATMASALYTDIKRKEGQSIFIRPHEGLFGLREWIEQGMAFQDEFAEEMAKRARAAFGAYGLALTGMPPIMPPMVDSEGVAIPPAFPPMMAFPGMPPMMPGMPMMAMHLPHGGPGAVPGAGAPPAAAAGKAGASDDSADGLMELLCAAEELHKAASKDAEGATTKYAADGSALPPAGAKEEAAEGERGAAMDAGGGAAQQPAGAQQPAEQATPAGSQGEAAAAPADEDGDAAAMLAAVAEAAAEEPEADGTPPAEQSGGGAAQRPAGFPGFDPAAAAAAGAMPYHPMQYPPYGYPAAPYPYYHPWGYPQPAAGLPPLPKQQGRRGEELAPAASAAGLDLTVRGSSLPLGRSRAGRGGAASVAAAVEAEGQEQVNILNLPLPEGGAAAARRGGGAAAPPVGGLQPEQLKEAEAQVMQLERELGTSHPEVGKAYLSLSRLYLAGVEESSSKQLAVAALSRCWEILNVCQVALKRQPSCTSSFSYLMDKIRAVEAGPGPAAPATATPTAAGAALAEQRPMASPAATGEAAHLALPASAVKAH